MPFMVFGANGYLGSLVTNQLALRGESVLAVTRPSSDVSRLFPNPNLNIIKTDVSEWQERVLSLSPHTVICANWQGVERESRYIAERQFENFKLISDLAVASKSSGVSTFLVFGSQAECRETNEKIKEKFYSGGTSPYGLLKSQLYLHLHEVFKGSRVRLLWPRVFSVYGPSSTAKTLVTELLRSAKDSSFKIKIERPNQNLSLLHERDFANALLLLLESQASGIINVANANLVPVKEIARLILGEQIVLQYENLKDDLGFFPVTETLDGLGWFPVIDIHSGIAEMKKVN